VIENGSPSIFTIEIGRMPTLVFETQNLREAHELCYEQWLKGDLADAKRDGVPLWDGKAKLRARMALPDEIALFAEAQNNGEPPIVITPKKAPARARTRDCAAAVVTPVATVWQLPSHLTPRLAGS
jgi:hypothetical protein